MASFLVSAPSLNVSLLTKYLLHSLLAPLPDAYEELDTNRLTLVHFCVHSLSIVKGLDKLGPKNLQVIIDWIYNLQVTSASIAAEAAASPSGAERRLPGFVGGTFHGHSFGSPSLSPYSSHHIAMTYTALLTLLALGDDLSRVDAMGILLSLRDLQVPDGSFKCLEEGSESDMRFVYCAVCIERILLPLLPPSFTSFPFPPRSFLSRPALLSFVSSCRGYDDGIALVAGLESHGGSAFCAVAALEILGELDGVLPRGGRWREGLVQWLAARQVKNGMGGMQGRPNKDEDTCYSFWVAGALSLLLPETLETAATAPTSSDKPSESPPSLSSSPSSSSTSSPSSLVDDVRLTQYVLTCQHPRYGGLSKAIGGSPDVLHTFYSLAYLSLRRHEGLGEVCVKYGCGKDVGDIIDKRYEEYITNLM